MTSEMWAKAGNLLRSVWNTLASRPDDSIVSLISFAGVTSLWFKTANGNVYYIPRSIYPTTWKGRDLMDLITYILGHPSVTSADGVTNIFGWDVGIPTGAVRLTDVSQVYQVLGAEPSPTPPTPPTPPSPPSPSPTPSPTPSPAPSPTPTPSPTPSSTTWPSWAKWVLIGAGGLVVGAIVISLVRGRSGGKGGEYAHAGS